MLRRGFSNIVVGGILILILSTIFTLYLVYLDSSQYRLVESGRSIEKDLIRSSEDLEARLVNNNIYISNRGSTPVKLRYLVIKGPNSSLDFIDMNITIYPGESSSIQAPTTYREIYLVSNRGRIFPVNMNNSINVNDPIYDVIFWHNETHFSINLELNGSSFTKLENSILIIDTNNGYLVVDLLKGSVLYNGRYKIIPSRDGRIVIVNNSRIYVDGRPIINGPFKLEYMGFDYVVIKKYDGLKIVRSDGVIQSYGGSIKDVYMIFNGNYTYVIEFGGVQNNKYLYTVYKFAPFNYSLLDIKTLSSYFKASGDTINNLGTSINSNIFLFDDGLNLNRVGIVEKVPVQLNIMLPIIYSSLILDNGTFLTPRIESLYRKINGSIINFGIIYDALSSTLNNGFPMSWSSAISTNSPTYAEDTSIYRFLQRNGLLSIYLSVSYGYTSGINNFTIEHDLIFTDGDRSITFRLSYNISSQTGTKEFGLTLFGEDQVNKYRLGSISRYGRPATIHLYIQMYIGLGGIRGFVVLYDGGNITSLPIINFELPYGLMYTKFQFINRSRYTSITNGYMDTEITLLSYGWNSYVYTVYTGDILMDGKIDKDSIYIDRAGILDVKEFISLYDYGKWINIIANYISNPVNWGSIYVEFPMLNIHNLTQVIDRVGLYRIQNGVFHYLSLPKSIPPSWDVISYRNLFLVVYYRVGGVDIYVKNY